MHTKVFLFFFKSLISLLIFESQNITLRQSSPRLVNWRCDDGFPDCGLVPGLYNICGLDQTSGLFRHNSLLFFLSPPPPQFMPSVPHPAKYPWNIGQSASSRSLVFVPYCPLLPSLPLLLHLRMINSVTGPSLYLAQGVLLR